MRGSVGSLFKIDGGDGDPSFFDQAFTARRVEESWFSGTLPRGEAYLLRIESGNLSGEYIAITSRIVASLKDQLENNNWISVVIHFIRDPGVGFSPTLESAEAVGMAAIEAL